MRSCSDAVRQKFFQIKATAVAFFLFTTKVNLNRLFVGTEKNDKKQNHEMVDINAN